MKSGLEGQNNILQEDEDVVETIMVSMKSGLEGRNNPRQLPGLERGPAVSMKSGLEGRNNPAIVAMVNVIKKVSQ